MPDKVPKELANKDPRDEAQGSTAVRREPPKLSGKQRKLLRGRAHHLAAVVLVGQAGTTEAVIRAVNEALDAHELVKVRCRRPENKRQWAQELAQAAGATLCGLIGHTAILYRPRPRRDAAGES